MRSDLIEEVARPLLDSIPLTMPLRRHVRGRLTQAQRLRRVVEDVLVGAGLSEAYTWSLVANDPSPDAIRLPNPMTSDQAILRTTIVPGSSRRRRPGSTPVPATSRCSRSRACTRRPASSSPSSGGRSQVSSWAATTSSRASWRRSTRRSGSTSASSAATDPLLHPGKAAATGAGWLGELHPTLLEGSWGAFELDLDELFADVPERVVYEDVITYPATLQDIAVAVDEGVEVGALVDAAREAAGELLREARVFDVYRGDQVGAARKSVAIHLAFQSPERTLTEEEATEVRGRIVAALAERFGAELRA